MKKLLCIAMLLMFSGLAFGQATPVPVCDATHLTNCTDYFGVGNWANSPLPAGVITGYTLIAGGSGYSATPTVSVTDPTGASFSFALLATDVTAGVITSITGGTTVLPGSYTAPVITIVDATGTGAMATAVLGGPFTGGIHKFVDPLASLPIAVPDTTTFLGSDYYEIGLTQYTQKMHTDLPATTLRGYVQLNNGTAGSPPAQSYLGPVILAQKNRPVRVLFKNMLSTGAGGNLFIPVDTTYMGAGAPYTQNRATLHLHGGATPWISDGTPHQWTVPALEAGPQRGNSTAFVPDMWFDSTTHAPITSCAGQGTCAVSGATIDPGPGSMTFYWTNQQGGRLMFYHDHAYGITRLNVYAGEAAGYLLVDPVEENTLAAATAPGTVGTAPDLAHLIPLVIQDKTFVPSQPQLAAQDPTWIGNFGISALNNTTSNGNGDLWFPHVYMPNQNPADPGLASGFGRWDYGPWFFPPQTSLTAGLPSTAVTVACTSSAFPGQTLAPSTACPTCGCPITPNASGTPEAFMDTPVVNGVSYPVLHVAPAAYRLQILAAGNDRSWNLSWFVADPLQNNTEVAMLPAAPPLTGAALPLCGPINPVAVPQLGLGLVSALLDATGNPMNGTGLPPNCWPNYGPLKGIPAPQTMWAADGRAGGAPDPRNAGPAWIQIGTEGGLLPAPVVIPATPVNFEQNTRSITIGSVAMHGLWLGPAERADVIVDFSQFSGKTLILYNDAATPAPAFDSRLDYFTGDGDQSPIGGAPNTPPGYGPNTRTIMQVVVDGTAPNNVPFSLTALKAGFASTATTPGLFASTQPPIIVPEAIYHSAYNLSLPNSYMAISANNLTFTPLPSLPPLIFDQTPCTATPPATCAVLDQKAIQELFTLDYGRMNATLGTEVPLTNFQAQTTIPLGYVDWPTELIQAGQTQLWKITHNGVDTHFIHFHLFNVQVINRVGWDGSLRQPDPNEVGWKDTVRMNPLEDILVALQPITPTLPFPLPDSIRLMDVTFPTAQDPAISGLDPTTGNATLSTVNQLVNFGWEYVWHCHILGHEENDMMRPIIFQVAPPAPSNLVAALSGTQVNLSWTDNSASESSFTVQRDTSAGFLTPTSFTVGPSAPATSYGGTITFNDPAGVITNFYRVQASDDFSPASPNPALFQPNPMSSAWSNTATAGLSLPTVTFTGAPASAVYNTSFTVTATTNAGVTPTITGTGACVFGPVSTTSQLVTMTSGTGTCSLTATWAATTTFASATLTQTTLAAKATALVSFTGALANAAYNTSFGVTATTTAGVPPTITGTAGICSVGPVSIPGFPSATAQVTMISGTGTCTQTASWPANTNYLAAVFSQSTSAIKVNSATTITSSSPSSSVVGQPVTVNFRVASNVALTGGATGPTGTVTVTGNGNSCTGTLTPGVGPGSAAGTGSCVLTLTSVGPKTLTAVYNPDSNFFTSTSAGVPQQVRDFSITARTASQSVNGNQKATYTMNLTSLNSFAGTVALTCGGTYPASFACSVAPASVNLTVTGAGSSQNVTVTVTTVKGSPATFNVTATGKFGTGIPATGGLTHTATATLTTKN